MLLVDPEGQNSYTDRQQSKFSYMTGVSRQYTSINDIIDEEAEDDRGLYSYEQEEDGNKSYSRGHHQARIQASADKPIKAKKTMAAYDPRRKKSSFGFGATHLFELLEMEISRHKSHTLQTYFNIMDSKNRTISRLQSQI